MEEVTETEDDEVFYSMKDFVDNRDPGLYETIVEFCKKEGKKISFLYEFEDHAGKRVITKQLISDIKCEKKQPSKRTVLYIILKLELNLEDAQYLMGKAGYRLTHSSKADSVVIYLLRGKKHYPATMNNCLKKYADTDLEHYK